MSNLDNKQIMYRYKRVIIDSLFMIFYDYCE